MTADIQSKVLNRRYGHDTELEVWGDPENVGKWWAQYQQSYSPLGYDTRLTWDETVDGVRTIRTTRSHTCD